MLAPVCPTMMDDRIGNIGSTQGVNDSSKPATKNTPSTTHVRPLRSAPSMLDSLAGAVPGASPVAVVAGAEAAGDVNATGPLPSGANTLTSPSPP